jgi:hypothetical protein
MTPMGMTMSRHNDDHRHGEDQKPGEDQRIERLRREAEAKALAERLQKKDEREAS